MADELIAMTEQLTEGLEKEEPTRSGPLWLQPTGYMAKPSFHQWIEDIRQYLPDSEQEMIYYPFWRDVFANNENVNATMWVLSHCAKDVFLKMEQGEELKAIQTFVSVTNFPVFGNFVDPINHHLIFLLAKRFVKDMIWGICQYFGIPITPRKRQENSEKLHDLLEFIVSDLDLEMTIDDIPTRIETYIQANVTPYLGGKVIETYPSVAQVLEENPLNMTIPWDLTEPIQDTIHLLRSKDKRSLFQKMVYLECFDIVSKTQITQYLETQYELNDYFIPLIICWSAAVLLQEDLCYWAPFLSLSMYNEDLETVLLEIVQSIRLSGDEPVTEIEELYR